MIISHVIDIRNFHLYFFFNFQFNYVATFLRVGNDHLKQMEIY